MFNLNSGYVGMSRSVRSDKAIASYEVPLSMINKHKITANKVEWFKEYESYSDLTKNHKEYKSTKKYLII